MNDSRKKYLGIDGLKAALSSFLVGIKSMISAISEPSLTEEDFDDIFSTEEESVHGN